MIPLRHSPLTPSPVTVQVQMRRVLLALTPGIVLHATLFGWGILIQLLIASATALALEALMVWLRAKPVGAALGDYSALVTAWLLAICIPPMLPWWMTMLGVGFAIVIAKHLYGGLGYNPFNPAMIAYAVLLISFPLEMTSWLAPLLPAGQMPGFADTLALIFAGADTTTLDSISAATPLDHFKHSHEAIPGLLGMAGGRGWEWLAMAWLAGGAWLLFKGVIDWRIPLGLLATVLVFSGVLATVSDNPAWQNPLFHLLSGGAMLAAFFIATDPVTAATTPRGRLIYGAGIGLLAMIIRTWGGYPDGFAFAVLLMNLAAPLIDYLTPPRAYGH